MKHGRPLHAVPAETSKGHRVSPHCLCGPVAMRDLETGELVIWRHHPYQTSDTADRKEPEVSRESAAAVRGVASTSEVER